MEIELVKRYSEMIPVSFMDEVVQDLATQLLTVLAENEWHYLSEMKPNIGDSCIVVISTGDSFWDVYDGIGFLTDEQVIMWRKMPQPPEGWRTAR